MFKPIKKVLMFPVFYLVLRPLISRNYRLRREGNLPDEWYWADVLAIRYGYAITSLRPFDFIKIPKSLKWPKKEFVPEVYMESKDLDALVRKDPGYLHAIKKTSFESVGLAEKGRLYSGKELKELMGEKPKKAKPKAMTAKVKRKTKNSV